MKFNIPAVLIICQDSVRSIPRVLQLIALVAYILLSSVAPAQTSAASPNSKSGFTSFDFPGAVNTQATAITPSGDIVGRYFNADGSEHGFLLSEGEFKSIDVPNSTLTDVTWINPRGQIVGDYNSSGKVHGFLLSRGNFTTIDYPGVKVTLPGGISPSGDIVGLEIGSDGILHGFLLTKQSGFISIDFPGAAGTLPTMVIGKRIIGGYFGATGTHGFELSGGNFRSIDCPGATSVFLSGLNPQGDMTGEVTGKDGIQHGLLVRDGNCITVDFPGSLPGSNYANGINPRGDIVGRYATLDGVFHAYLRDKDCGED
jgi:hypothetical protein